MIILLYNYIKNIHGTRTDLANIYIEVLQLLLHGLTQCFSQVDEQLWRRRIGMQQYTFQRGKVY